MICAEGAASICLMLHSVACSTISGSSQSTEEVHMHRAPRAALKRHFDVGGPPRGESVCKEEEEGGA